MLRRRILLYFILAMTASVVAAVVFAWRASDRAIAETRKNELLFARSVARFVGGLVEREGERIDHALAELPAEIKDPADARRHLLHLQDAMLGASGIAVFDRERNLVLSLPDRGGLPPQTLLLPALRRAAESDQTIVSDLWQGIDGKPRVALIRAHGEDETWRAAVASVRVDSPEFLSAFSYFLVDDHARLQVLDSTGVAIFSTHPEERYRSVVHGTYFSDAVREGKSTQLSCHSCHENGDREPQRDNEVMTLAPVLTADWSVTIREGTDKVVAARREQVFSHIALVSVILGAFLGFFFALRRHVLRPMRSLSHAAAQLSHGAEGASALLAGRDELSVLAESFEEMRESGRRAARGDAPVDVRPPVVGQTGDSIVRALERAFDSIFGDIVGVGPVRAIAAFVEIAPGGATVLRAREIAFDDEATAGPTLVAASRPKSITPVETLAEACDGFRTSDDVRAFYVHELRVFDSFKGRLWIGLGAGYESGGSYLGSTLALFASQITSLIERGYLYEQLRTEHAHKNRMLGHLFEAEAEERKRIARGIHDQTAQDLTALLLLLETFPSADEAEEQQAALARARECVGELMDGTERLIRRLRPAVLDDLGLVEAIRAIGCNLLEPAGIELTLTVEGEGRPIPKRVEIAVFRVMQEATTNVVRHSGATRVTASLVVAPDHIECSFRDDGRGMDLSWLDDTAARPRWGVLGMRERIAQIGGSILFSAPPDGGVQIDIEVPFTAAERETAPEYGKGYALQNHPGR
jgi:signal transduction histidine kinase